MSSPYDRSSSSRRRGVWGHWVPLVLTVTVATVGLAAWAWSQRNDDEEDAEPIQQGLDYENADYGDNPPYGASTRGAPKPPPSFTSDLRPGEMGEGTIQLRDETAGNAGWGAKMSGALRRTPSPQQFFDSAGKTVAAGVAATGVAVKSALAAIREEDKNAYADHNTWSEEADAKKTTKAGPSSKDKESNKKRKTVVIVVSADTQLDDLDDDFHEHASILSHIPKQNDFAKMKLFVLIYAPGLKEAALDAPSNQPPASLSSSFSNIGHDQAQSPKDEGKSPLLVANSSNPAFTAVYSQALGLVEKEGMIIPFTSANGHAHILRTLDPEIIYLQESLAGDNGSMVKQLQTWLRHDVVLVVGAESGHGGLADSESEAEKTAAPQKWWQRDDRVGRGRGVIVVDGMRVHDDWAKRVQGKE